MFASQTLPALPATFNLQPSFAAVTAALASPTARMRLLMLLVLTVMATALLTPEAWAGAGGAEFDQIYDQLVGWMQGTPGKIVMILSIIVGLIMAVTTQSIAAVAVSLGLGIILYYANGVVDTIFVAALPLP